jgi:hypothetical protein
VLLAAGALFAYRRRDSLCIFVFSLSLSIAPLRDFFPPTDEKAMRNEVLSRLETPQDSESLPIGMT